MKCAKCGEKFPADKLYIYVDESNHKITDNRPLCLKCYKKVWGHLDANK